MMLLKYSSVFKVAIVRYRLEGFTNAVYHVAGFPESRDTCKVFLAVGAGAENVKSGGTLPISDDFKILIGNARPIIVDKGAQCPYGNLFGCPFHIVRSV